MGRVRTLLIFPPQWSPQNPHGAITSIAGHLRSRGKEVQLRDLNVEMFHFLLQQQFIEYAIQKLYSSYEISSYKTILNMILEETNLDFEISARKVMEIERFLSEKQEAIKDLPRLIDEVKRVFRSNEFYDPYKLADSFALIDITLQLISLPYYPAQLSFYDYSDPLIPLTTKGVIEATEAKNIFQVFYKKVIGDIMNTEAEIMAISINAFSQVIPRLMLARWLKSERDSYSKTRRYPLIVIGGNYFTRLLEALVGNKEFFRYFCDVVVIGEGEKPMLEIVEALERGIPLEEVKGLVLEDNDGNPIYTGSSSPERLENLGIQDLEGLPLDLYFTPELVLPIQFSRGCYWGKCSFCDSDFGTHKDQKSIKRLIEEIRYLRDRYNVRHFEFVDESIHPVKMEEIAKRFISEDLGIHWFSNGRLESEFTFDRLRLLKESGLTMILWGFESGSERIMKLINKGIDLEDRWRVLRDADRAGIWNFAYIFFGFPTETKEEAMETIRAISENTDIIHSYGKSLFTLGKHSKLREDGRKYGILELISDPEELSTTLYYKTSGGMTPEEVQEMSRRCFEICRKAYGEPLWMYLRYRENIHLYLAKYGKDFVKNFKFREIQLSQEIPFIK